MDVKRIIVIVLDGVGAGEAPDAAAYGDVGSNSLSNTDRVVGGLKLPHMGDRAGIHHADAGCAACPSPHRCIRQDVAPLSWKRHHLRPLGDDGRDPRPAAAHLSGRLSS